MAIILHQISLAIQIDQFPQSITVHINHSHVAFNPFCLFVLLHKSHYVNHLLSVYDIFHSFVALTDSFFLCISIYIICVYCTYCICHIYRTCRSQLLSNARRCKEPATDSSSQIYNNKRRNAYYVRNFNT